MKTTNETTVNTQATYLAAYREMIGKAAEECQDLELLDLVYKLLVTSGEEAQV